MNMNNEVISATAISSVRAFMGGGYISDLQSVVAGAAALRSSIYMYTKCMSVNVYIIYY